MFDAATPTAFEACARRALALKRDASAWQAVMRRGMSEDLSWAGPAREYLALYLQARSARAQAPRGLQA
jgi:starch synthase